MNQIRTTCPYCGVGCGLIVSPTGAIKGDPDHPSNFGRICSKGAALGETLGLEDRILAPRVNGEAAKWNPTLDLVARKFSQAIKDHGPDSVAFYVSGQLLTEDYYVANKLMKGYIGSANIDTNSRLCMASTVAGHKRAFGTDTVPGSYEDIEQADVVVLVGSNLAWCHPVLHQRLTDARAQRPQMKTIVVDPRRTPTSKAADLHLRINADSDTALFNSLLNEIERRGFVDKSYVNANVSGFESAMKTARTTDPTATGLTDYDLRAFHDLWIGSQKVVTIFSQGVNQSTSGTDKVNAIINCHLATGKIGRAGMGPFSVTGQPNAMGGREVGGLANMLACHLDIENPDHREVVRDFWNSPNNCTQPGLKAVELFQACADNKIKALWIMGTNPAVSLPNANFVSDAIANVPFCVISDVTETDTTKLADVFLPATTWGEKTGTVTNSERRISLQRAFLPPPGEARPDWSIICEVAKRMGWSKAFSYSSTAEIFREYATLSGKAAELGRDFDISGLSEVSDEDYANLAPTKWPISNSSSNEDRFFANGDFFHSDGKAKMVPVKSSAVAVPKYDEFLLNTGRIRDQWHTMTRSGKSPRLSQHTTEPFAEINSQDARRLGVADAELLEISAQNSRAIVRARVTPDVSRGAIFMPMHWNGTNASAGGVNAVIAANCDPISGQPALKNSSVEIRPFKPTWFAFAASSEPMRPQHTYSAVSRTPTGWSCELADVTSVSDWISEARKVLNLEIGNASVLYDSAKGVARVAIYKDKVLAGIFFASPEPLNIAREFTTSLIAGKLPAFVALAGVPMSEQPDPGKTICACFNVGINTLRDSIIDGASSVNELGWKTFAGTNCGSCKPELQNLIDAAKVQIAAA